MRRFAGAFAAVSMLLLAAAQAQDVTLEVSDATISAGATGQITIALNAGANEVAGTENELGWDTAELSVGNCVVNEAIDKMLQSTEGDGTFKGIIINFSDLSPIDDGSTLYTCDVTVPGGAAPGDYTVACTAPGSSDPTGGSFDTACNDATITVPADPQVMLSLNMIEAVPGGTATLTVTLDELLDVEVAGTENELRWDPSQVSVSNCEVNPDIMKDLQQTNDVPGEFKGIIINFSDLSPIDDGSVLYSCDVGIPGGTAAATSGVLDSFEIECAEPGSSDPLGNTLITICNNATVNVVEPTATPTQIPTATPIPTDTATQPPVDTPTSPPTGPTDTPTQAPNPNDEDDDSCAIVEPQTSSSGWMLMLPMAALLWLRRRTR